MGMGQGQGHALVSRTHYLLSSSAILPLPFMLVQVRLGFVVLAVDLIPGESLPEDLRRGHVEAVEAVRKIES